MVRFDIKLDISCLVVAVLGISSKLFCILYCLSVAKFKKKKQNLYFKKKGFQCLKGMKEQSMSVFLRKVMSLFPQTRFLQAASVGDRLPLLADLISRL